MTIISFLRIHLSLVKLLLPALLLAMLANAHPGKQDAQGGHVNHTNGEYHCHAQRCFARHKQAADALQEAVKEQRAFSKIYVRKDWPHWSDLDRDCQDTRAEILIAASKVPVTFNRGNRCYKVVKGEWFDPYTNRIFFDAGKLDIDHRIALKEAHVYGGANWTTVQKEQFANDPLNLIPVQHEANESKSAHPAYEWMPKNMAFWCEYIRAREAVVEKYALHFPQKEVLFNLQIKQQHCH